MVGLRSNFNALKPFLADWLPVFLQELGNSTTKQALVVALPRVWSAKKIVGFVCRDAEQLGRSLVVKKPFGAKVEISVDVVQAELLEGWVH